MKRRMYRLIPTKPLVPTVDTTTVPEPSLIPMTTSPPWQGISYVEDKRGKWWYEEGYGVRVYDGVSWLGHVAGLPDYPWCWLGRLVPQSIPNVTLTRIEWLAEFDDPHNMHSNVLNPARITAPEDGLYIFTVGISWEFISNSGFRILALIPNSDIASHWIETYYQTANDTTDPDQALTAQFKLTAGEWVEAWVYHNRGASLSINQRGTYSPSITAAKICQL